MRLVYTANGAAVQIGDKVALHDDEAEVTFFRKPHKPESSGKITVTTKAGMTREFYVSVIGAEWIEREDRDAI